MSRGDTESMEIKFWDVIERDIDLIILEELASSQEFVDIFLSKVGLSNATVVGLEHSKTDVELGESDITVILQIEDRKHGLLIEDKIDAMAQPEQCKRYFERGELGIKNGDYSSFDVFMIAPEKYLNGDMEAAKYPNKVLYEEMISYFERKNDSRSEFKLAQINYAISHQKTGYQLLEVASVTEFWDRYIDYQEENYPHLASLNIRGPKGARSTWFHYKTVHKDVTLVHKSEKGYVDLSFRGAYDKIPLLVELFEETNGSIKQIGMSIEPAGKSAVLRAKVPSVDVLDAFDNYRDEVDACLKAVEMLNDIALRLDVKKVQKVLVGL